MKKIPLSLVATVIVGVSLHADELSELKAKIIELQEKTDALIDETSDLKTGFSHTTVEVDASQNGMGPAASKVYYSKSPLSIGGYGEMYWASEDKRGERAYADVYRFVPYIGYKFSDEIILNSELEFEHGGEEVAIEFMYLDFLFNRSFNIQAGNLLVPMGLVNRRHEPTLFNTIQRPDVEKYIIPSTWHENGVVVYGSIGESGFSYSAGIINGLNLKNISNDGVTQPSKNWIKNGRIGSQNKGPMERVAFVGRVDYTGRNGVLLGSSVYYGGAAQGDPNGVNALIYDIHALYEKEGFKLKALYTALTLDGAEKIGPRSAKSAEGYFINMEYDILASKNTSKRVPLFVQYESYDPVSSVVSGARPDLEQTNITVGVNFFPHEQVVLKADYVFTNYNDANSEDFNTFSVGMGFIF